MPADTNTQPQTKPTEPPPVMPWARDVTHPSHCPRSKLAALRKIVHEKSGGTDRSRGTNCNTKSCPEVELLPKFRFRESVGTRCSRSHCMYITLELIPVVKFLRDDFHRTEQPESSPRRSFYRLNLLPGGIFQGNLFDWEIIQELTGSLASNPLIFQDISKDRLGYLPCQPNLWCSHSLKPG